MKQVYKCEYCEEILENKNDMYIHERECGQNPKNKINDEIVTKLSRIQEHFIDSLLYVLLNDFSEEKINFYKEEFERATRNNCPASVYENKKEMKNVFIDVTHYRFNETEYFKKVTLRDNPEFIETIRTYLKEPEFRINKNRR